MNTLPVNPPAMYSRPSSSSVIPSACVRPSCPPGRNRSKFVAVGEAFDLKHQGLLVLDGFDDALAGGGSGGEETCEDPDKEAGEEGCERGEFGVEEVDLETPCAGAEDKQVSEQGADGDADEASDEAYDDPLVYDEPADLEPRRPHGTQYADLAGTLEDAHGQGVDDPEGRDGDRDAHDGVEEDVLAVEVVLYLSLPLCVGVQRELRVASQDLLDLPGQRAAVRAWLGLYGEELALLLVEVAREHRFREVDARPATDDVVLQDPLDRVLFWPFRGRKLHVVADAKLARLGELLSYQGAAVVQLREGVRSSGGVVDAEDLWVVLVHPEDDVHLLAVAQIGGGEARGTLDAGYLGDLLGESFRECDVGVLARGLHHVVAAQRALEVGPDRAEHAASQGRERHDERDADHKRGGGQRGPAPVPRRVRCRHPALYAEEQAQNGGEQGGQGTYQRRGHERDA